MSRPTNNSSGRGRGPEASRPHSASPSPPGSLRSDGDHVASASLADMFSAPSHEVVGEASHGDGFDAISGGSPDVDSSLPPLLPILDSAPVYESPFLDWFEANFAVPDCRARLLSNHAAQPQLILDWLGLLYTAWRASTTPRASAAFGMQLLGVLLTSLPASFIKPFLMFYPPREPAGPPALTQVASHVKPASYAGKIDAHTFDALRAHVKDGYLSGNWQHVVNDCFDKALGHGHIITFTDLGTMTPLALMHQLGAGYDISKFLPSDLRSSAPPPTDSPSGTLQSLLADGAGRKSDKDILLSRFGQLQSLLVPHRLTSTQVEQLQCLVSLLSPGLQDIPSSTLISHTAHAMNNLCSFICSFCIALAGVMVELRVRHSERWANVVKHVCPLAQHSRLETVTIDGLQFSQVLDPLTKALRNSCSLFAVLPAFQAVASLMEILAVVPSSSKHAVLLNALSFRFDLSRSLLSEMQRFFDVRSAALQSLGPSPFFSGSHPALTFPAVQDMLTNNLYGVRLEKSIDNIALESFLKNVLPACKSFEDILHGVRSVSGDHALQGNAADAPAPASVHVASSQSANSNSAPSASRRPSKSSRSARKAASASSSSPSRAAEVSGASSSSKPPFIDGALLQNTVKLGRAVVQILKAHQLDPSDYVRRVQFQNAHVHVWLRESADTNARIVKLPSAIFKSLKGDDHASVVALMRAGNRQFKDYFVSDVFGSQVRSRPSTNVARVATASRLSSKSLPPRAQSSAALDYPAAAEPSAALNSSYSSPVAPSPPPSQVDASTMAIIDKALSLISSHHQQSSPPPPAAQQPSPPVASHSQHALGGFADNGPGFPTLPRPDFPPQHSPSFLHGGNGGAPMPFPGPGVFPNYACGPPFWQPPMPFSPQMPFPQLDGSNSAPPSDSN